MSAIDIELSVYKARFQWTNEHLCEVLDISDTAFRSKRKGRAPFTAKELKRLSELLGKTMEEVYDLLPEINH